MVSSYALALKCKEKQCAREGVNNEKNNEKLIKIIITLLTLGGLGMHLAQHTRATVDRSMALRFSVLAECPVSKARVASMVLPHHTVDTPVFMPVGTQGSLKGLTSHQLAVGLTTECQIMLGNTYHLANKPVSELG